MCGVSPRTRLIPLLGVLALLSACGEPPQAMPTSPPYATPSPSLAIPSLPIGPLPTLTGYPTNPVTPGYPTYATPPAFPTRTATTAPTSKSPTPTPTHAARCTGQPTGAQILNLIKGKAGVPNAALRVFEGPFCSGSWSFTTVAEVGSDTDEVDPLMVVATGRADPLGLVAAGSDVCIARVETEAPPGIRVLACGF